MVRIAYPFSLDIDSGSLNKTIVALVEESHGRQQDLGDDMEHLVAVRTTLA
jgi:hypothetical protein